MSTAVPKKEKHPDLVRFGNAVRARRKELGYSQEAFADVVALDRGYTGGVERGSHNITLLNILKIIDKLEMSHSEFFAVFESEAFHYRDDAVRAEKSHQIVFERDVEP